MATTNQRQAYPDMILADIILRQMPRAGKISKASLLAIIYKRNPQEYTFYRDYLEVAFEILCKEKLIETIKTPYGGSSETEYVLTNEGRILQDAGGYLKRYKEKLTKDAFDKRVSRAEGNRKIFDNKVKYVLFLVVVLTAIVGFWRNRSSNAEKTREQSQSFPLKDTAVNQRESQSKTGTASRTGARQQSQNHVIQSPIDSKSHHPSVASGKESDNNTSVAAPKTSAPIQVANADNIDFKLMKARGNSNAQSVTLTLTLITSAANTHISSNVKSIIDDDGNEYKLSSFTNGASTYLSTINLVTNVPIKCTYTFGGVLPGVKTIKLFKYDYYPSEGQPRAVEFRDIPVDWQ